MESYLCAEAVVATLEHYREAKLDFKNKIYFL